MDFFYRWIRPSYLIAVMLVGLLALGACDSGGTQSGSALQTENLISIPLSPNPPKDVLWDSP